MTATAALGPLIAMDSGYRFKVIYKGRRLEGMKYKGKHMIYDPAWPLDIESVTADEMLVALQAQIDSDKKE